MMESEIANLSMLRGQEEKANTSRATVATPSIVDSSRKGEKDSASGREKREVKPRSH